MTCVWSASKLLIKLQTQVALNWTKNVKKYLAKYNASPCCDVKHEIDI